MLLSKLGTGENSDILATEHTQSKTFLQSWFSIFYIDDNISLTSTLNAVKNSELAKYAFT